MNQKYIIAAFWAACSLSAWGQEQVNDTTLNRMVVVEQEYNPQITDANKVNVIPAIPAMTTSKKTVEYDLTATPATHLAGTAMSAFTGKEKQNLPTNGEVRVGYGNQGNLDAAASYHLRLSEKDRLNLQAGISGQDGKLDLSTGEGKWNSHFYRSKAAVDWLHLFRQVSFNLGGNLGLSNFNFEPESLHNKQKFTSGAFHVQVKSINKELPVQFQLGTCFMLFQRQHDFYFNDSQEGILRTQGAATAAINETQRIGLELQMDNIFYKNTFFKNQTSIQLTPYYLIENNNWNLRLGAHVDPAFGFGKKFHVAPDVNVQYTLANSYVLYAQAQGGKLLNDYRRLETLSPYSQLDTQMDATYEQINASIGFKGSPLSGWWFHIYGGYQNLKNDLIEDETFYGQDTRNIYAGIETRYDYKNLFTVTASGIYRNWDTDNDENSTEAALFWKPALEARATIGFRPLSPLFINLGYQHISREKVAGEKLDDVSNLYLEGNYQLFKYMDIYAHIYNLLNQDYAYHWGCQAAGINFVGGVRFHF